LRQPIDPGISPVCGLTRPCPSDEGDPWPDLPPSRHIEIPTTDSPPRPLLPPKPLCPCWCPRFVRVVRQGVPNRAQRKDLHRALEIPRDDETRWRPAHCSLSSRRRPPANHPDEPSGHKRIAGMNQRPARVRPQTSVLPGSIARLNPGAPAASRLEDLVDEGLPVGTGGVGAVGRPFGVSGVAHGSTAAQ